MDVLTVMMANYLDRHWYGGKNARAECVMPVLWRLAIAGVFVGGVVALLGLAGSA